MSVLINRADGKMPQEINLREFAEKHGLPFDPTGKIDMTVTFQAAVDEHGTFYIDPGVYYAKGPPWWKFWYWPRRAWSRLVEAFALMTNSHGEKL